MASPKPPKDQVNKPPQPNPTSHQSANPVIKPWSPPGEEEDDYDMIERELEEMKQPQRQNPPMIQD
jgi:hypothetical protein